MRNPRLPVMSWRRSQSLLDRTFVVSVILKGLNGALEVVGGLLLLIISPETINRTIVALTQSELSDDPRDFFASHMAAMAHLTESSALFGALYLLSHGIVKIVLVVAVLKKKLWAYPWMIAFLGSFIVYQLYRMTFAASIGLVALTIFDVFVGWLTYLEYRKHRREDSTRDLASGKPTSISVSPARPDDAEGIAVVQHDTWLDTYPNAALGITHAAIKERVRGYQSPERIAKWRDIIGDTAEYVVVAKDGVRVVGFSCAKKGEPANQVTAIYVLPGYHGTGVARTLMDATMRWLSDERDVIVEVASYNDRAIAFYRKYGFDSTGETGSSGAIPTIFMSRPAAGIRRE